MIVNANPLVVGVTGHRPDKLGGYGNTAQQKVIDFAYNQLQILQNSYNIRKVITGMALGWDQAVALACSGLEIPYVAAVPFVGQESKWPVPAQRIYTHLVSMASEVVVVSEGGYEEWKMEARNRWIVERSDLMVALFDGSSGGTNNCLIYAGIQGVEKLNLWPDWQKSLEFR